VCSADQGQVTALARVFRTSTKAAPDPLKVLAFSSSRVACPASVNHVFHSRTMVQQLAKFPNFSRSLGYRFLGSSSPPHSINVSCKMQA
jgi:hypothetical protein